MSGYYTLGKKIEPKYCKYAKAREEGKKAMEKAAGRTGKQSAKIPTNIEVHQILVCFNQWKKHGIYGESTNKVF